MGLGVLSSLPSYIRPVSVLAVHTSSFSSSMKICYDRISKKPLPPVATSYSFLNDDTSELNVDRWNWEWHLPLLSQITNQTFIFSRVLEITLIRYISSLTVPNLIIRQLLMPQSWSRVGGLITPSHMTHFVFMA